VTNQAPHRKNCKNIITERRMRTEEHDAGMVRVLGTAT
jgi:hypothetical protein